MHQNQFFNSSLLRKISYAVAGFLVLILAASVILSQVVKSKMAERLPGELKYESLDVQLFWTGINLKNIHYAIVDSTGESTDLKCDLVQLKGISWRDLLFDKQLTVNELRVENVNGIFIHPVAKVEADTVSKKAAKRDLETILVKNFYLEDLNIRYIRRKEWQLKTEGLKLELNQTHYTLAQAEKALKYKGFKLSCDQIEWLPKSGHYDLATDNFIADSNGESLEVSNFQLKPKHSKADWKNHFRYKKSRLDLKVPKISGNGIDWVKLIDGKGFSGEKLTINGAKLYVRSTPELPSCMDCYKAMLHEKLVKAKLPIDIGILKLKNSLIAVEVPEKGGAETAKLTFEKVTGTIENVTNIPAKIAAKNEISADISASLMGESQLDAKFNFALNDPNFSYGYSATLERLDLVEFNKLLRLSKNAKIKSGMLRKLKMNATGDNKLATGEMSFNYENLKVEILKKDKNKPRKFLTALVNKLGIKKDNEEEESDFKTGKMYYERKPNRAMFHQFWFTILSGFKSTILPKWLVKEELEMKN